MNGAGAGVKIIKKTLGELTGGVTWRGSWRGHVRVRHTLPHPPDYAATIRLPRGMAGGGWRPTPSPMCVAPMWSSLDPSHLTILLATTMATQQHQMHMVQPSQAPSTLIPPFG